MKTLVLTLSVCLVSGCASSQYSVEFDSNPQSAALTCSGRNWGHTPMTLYYPKEKLNAQSSLDLSDCTATWASGATARYGTISLDEFPNGVRTTAQRPNISNLQQDMEYNLKVQQLNTQKRQARAAENSALQQMLQNNKTTRCYTTYGMTTCY